MTTSLTKKQREKFLTLACQLSPESLTCDGELPDAQVRARFHSLMRQWHKLEAEVGRKVTEREAYDF